MLTIKIGGQAGWGIKSFGHWLLAAVRQRSGFGFFYPEYPSLIRGGHNTATVTLADRPVQSSWRAVDVLLALDQRTWQEDGPDLAKQGWLIAWEGDVPAAKRRWLLPAAWRPEIPPERQNSLFWGALLALLGWPERLGWEILQANLAAAERKQEHLLFKRGYRWGRERGEKVGWHFRPLKPGKTKILSGNEAIARGIAAAKCGYAAIYPMTPISAILHFLTAWQKKTKMVLFQPEDEIAGIVAAIGASYAGRRAMVATSGGGFALMSEALGMAGMSETPLVIVEGQRTGPSTGMPTWTEQADLQFVINASQSEFPRIVLAPGDARAAGRLAVTAFYLAEKYQLPVILLTDKFLAESWLVSQPLRFPKYRWPRLLLKAKNYARYQLTKTGVSPRAIPGRTLVVANSYEHDERGATSEESRVRQEQMAKRLGKLAGFQLPDGTRRYGPERARFTLVGWGSTKGPILEALAKLPEANLIHFEQVYPLPPLARKWLNSAGNLIAVENNSTGQLSRLLRQEWGVKPQRQLLKNDGRPFFPEEIISFVKHYGKN